MNCPHCGKLITVKKETLTEREQEIADIICNTNDSFKVINKRPALRYIDVQSLRNIASTIYKKLGVHSRNELTLLWKASDGDSNEERETGTPCPVAGAVVGMGAVLQHEEPVESV